MDKSIYKDKKYWHLDGHKTFDMVEWYITSDEKIAKHSFYPFIHYEMSYDKFDISKDYGERRSPKKRQIYYCSHIDRYIYQRFAYSFNNDYNKYCIDKGFDNCSIAYRNNKKGKCNIHFAKEVFEFIKTNENCFIMVGDFTNFFDNLDHKYLKKQLCRVSQQDELTEIQYKVFKSITRFSYFDIKDISTFLEIEQKKLVNLRPRIDSKNFHNLKKLSLKSNKTDDGQWKTYGIPQGSPISAVFANVYMIDFDEKLKSLTDQVKGLYRRYSDDFVIVLPNVCDKQIYIFVDNIMQIVQSIPNLVLENKKTAFYSYKNRKIEPKDNLLEGQKNKNKDLNFLGFSFNGEKIKLRDKTITKYYYKLYSIIDKQKRLELKRAYNNPKNRKDVKHRRTAIIKKKSKFGAKIINGKGTNFISYVKKCIKLFPTEQQISLIKDRNLDKISKRFNKKAK